MGKWRVLSAHAVCEKYSRQVHCNVEGNDDESMEISQAPGQLLHILLPTDLLKPEILNSAWTQAGSQSVGFLLEKKKSC